ncbi:MAG: acetate kinase [Elusimicrobia bacterium]|nr:acetate kinase [Elusimicrobiota bacterium]
MKILVLNCRIYSIEYEVFEMTNGARETELCNGIVDHIGFEQSILTHTTKNKTEKIVKAVLDHKKALELIDQTLLNTEYGVIKSKDDIDVIGHRIVHGGGTFTSSVIIDEDVKKEIYKDFELAPLHNPYNLKGVEAAETYFPGKPNVAVFDTSFHQTMPEVAYTYALPERLYHEYKIRKYGFHGTSHKYMSNRVAELLKKKNATMISLHLGAGSSACAIKDGKSIDTSMGFTPLEGLVMTDRPGDVDPGVIVYLLRSGWTLNEIELCLNKESGTLGISGISNEMKEIVEAADKGDEKAKLAVDVFAYRIRKYLGAYCFVLGGKVDAVSFTGRIGDNSPIIRGKILSGLEGFGIKLDNKKNEKAIGDEQEISSSDSKVKIFILPRNEKILIAREAMEVVTRK